MFDDFVDKCVVVYEATKYLEILNYSVSGRAILHSTGRQAWLGCRRHLEEYSGTDWRSPGFLANRGRRAHLGAG
jgi:hypothetical protein